MRDDVIEMLRAVSRGALSPDEAAARLSPETDLGFAVIDDDRESRTGLPEVVFGAGKPPDRIASIVSHLLSRGAPALVTRLDAEAARAVSGMVSGCVYEPVPRLLWAAPPGAEPFARRLPGLVAVVSAGTSDEPVAEEAARCAEFFGLAVTRVRDVGVAGLHRLLSRLDTLREAQTLIVVAGMEGALPSVVAGLVRAPVIAVPTSTGYGAHLGGLTPLLAMLDSCSGGLAVTNIDNGFGAAVFAARIARAHA